MRIGVFKPAMSEAGGTETFIREVVRRLSERHEVTLLTDELEQDIGVEVIELPMIKRFSLYKEWFEIESVSLFSSSVLRDVFRKVDADVWSTHYFSANILVSRYLNSPNLFRFPGIKKPHFEWRLMSKLANPDMYIANSESTRKRAKEWLDIDCEGVVHTGVDYYNRFTPNGEKAISNSMFNILYVGRLDRGKGLMDLIEAANGVDNSKVWFVGSGSLEGKIERHAERIGIEYEMTGYVEHRETPKYYRSADVFCLPSYHEGFPTVNLEAMSCGCPIVTSDIPATREQIDQKEEGIFFNKGDILDLREKLSYMRENVDERKKMGSKARQTAEKYDWGKVSEEMEKYYLEVMER